MTRRARILTAAVLAAAVSGVALSGCSSDEPHHPGTVSPSTVPGSLTDLSTIVIGWGQRIAPTEITHPAARDVRSTCISSGDKLKVRLESGPWTMTLTHGSPKIKVSNSGDDKLTATLDTSSKVPGTSAAIDWNQADQVDIAASPYVPASWPSAYGPNQQFYLSAHVDCRTTQPSSPAPSSPGR